MLREIFGSILYIMEGYNWSYGVIQRVNVMVAIMSIKSHQIEELDKFIFVVH